MRGRYWQHEIRPTRLEKKRRRSRDWAADIGQSWGIKGKGNSDDDVYEMQDGDDLGRN